MRKHANQKRDDEIIVLLHNGIPIACGYKCSVCNKGAYPLGTSFPEEILTKREKKILNQECIDA